MPTPSDRQSAAMGATSATILIIIGAICFGLSPLFAKTLAVNGVSTVSIVFFRYALAALALLPFLAVARGQRRLLFWALFAGLALSLGWIGYVEALKVAPVAAVGVIYMTYPLFTLLLAWMLVGLRPNWRSIFAGLLVVAAALLTLHPTLETPQSFRALLISFTAPVSFGLAVCILATKLTDLKPLERASGLMLGAVLGLLPVFAVEGTMPFHDVSTDDWPLLIGISVVAALLPNILYALGAPNVGPARTAMAGSTELPVMFLVGWLAFGEAITPLMLLAGGLVLSAIIITPPISPAQK